MHVRCGASAPGRTRRSEPVVPGPRVWCCNREGRDKAAESIPSASKFAWHAMPSGSDRLGASAGLRTGAGRSRGPRRSAGLEETRGFSGPVTGQLSRRWSRAVRVSSSPAAFPDQSLAGCLASLLLTVRVRYTSPSKQGTCANAAAALCGLVPWDAVRSLR